MEIFNWRYYWAEILAKADSKLGILMLKYYQMEQKKTMIMHSNESLIKSCFLYSRAKGHIKNIN